MGNDTKTEWREIAQRARALWSIAGGTYERLASLLWEHAHFVVNGGTLGQTMRGRKPREIERHVAALAKVFSVELKSRCPDLAGGDLAAAFKSHLYGRAGSPLEGSTPLELATAAGTRRSIRAVQALHLWMPGANRALIAQRCQAEMDPQSAGKLADLSISAVSAIAEGNFPRQLTIAEEAIRIGQAFPRSGALGEALYLKGEALRLLADFEDHRLEARRLRDSAISCYDQSETLIADPRPIRGRARTIEVLGDVDTALVQFRQSTALTEDGAAPKSELDRLSLVHETVRSLRHKLHCIAVIHAESLAHTSAARQRENELRRLLIESSTKHRDALKLFESSGDWWRIEWFMAEVIHAKGWIAVREFSRAAKHLEWALAQRLDMLRDNVLLSDVELGNFQWWTGAAIKVKEAFTMEQQHLLDQFVEVVNSGGAPWAAKSLGRRFLRAGDAPWKS